MTERKDHTLQIPYHQVIAYSLHIRGFTGTSIIKSKGEGTFRGNLKNWNIYRKILGLTRSIVCRYMNLKDTRYRNYWGYGAGSYFAPKAHILQMETELEGLKIW